MVASKPQSDSKATPARRGGPRSRNFTTYLDGTLEQRLRKLEKYEDKVTWYCGQDEIGDNGMEHIQLAFGFDNPRSLNLLQETLPNGANIQIAKDPAAVIKYVTDENKRNGKLYMYGDVPNFGKTSNSTTNTLFQQALEQGSFKAAMKYIEENDITTYIYHYKKLFAFFENKFAEGDKSKFKPEDFVRPLYNIPIHKTLVFIGPTGFGKTQFALAHFNNPLRVTNKQDWIRFREGYTDGIVLDDVHFNDWKPNTLLHTVDVENAVTQDVKYSAVRIPAGVPRIICINSEAELWPRDLDPEKKEAIQRRLSIVHISSPLYNRKRG